MKKIIKALRNAVLFKEVQVKSKKAGPSVLILIIGTVLGVAAFIAMMTTNLRIVGNEGYSGTVFIDFFIAVIIMEAAFLCFITPAITTGAISGERERQTLDVLLTTNMTPWEIIWGKYWSSIAHILVIVISTLPFLSIVFLFGGVSFWTVLGILLAMIASAMFIGSFGILMSTLMKKSGPANVLTYVIVMWLIFGTIMSVAIIELIVEGINQGIWQNDPSLIGVDVVNADWSLLLLLFNPATVAFDMLSRTFGFNLFVTDYYGGMGELIDSLSSGRLSDQCFLAKHWSSIAMAVQLFSAYWILKLASLRLNPVRKRRAKAGKNRQKGA